MRRRQPSVIATALLVALLATACTDATVGAPDDAAGGSPDDGAEDTVGVFPGPSAFPPGPSGVPAEDAPLDPTVAAALEEIIGGRDYQRFDPDTLATVVAAGDPRVGWFLADLVRFAVTGSELSDGLLDAFEALTGVPPDAVAPDAPPFVAMTDLLLAWDLPVWDGYRELKGQLFLRIEPRWRAFFEDDGAAVDWRWVTWGGVRIDDRVFGDPSPCPLGCIPALDDPALTDAAGGAWYPDERLVFGISLDGESIALPRHQMEIHEMVNLTLAGHDLGIPYCTLCGSAQAYRTSELPAGFDRAVLRTSGMLSRSNKLMFDLTSGSLIDTFTGEALSGPLHDAEVTLPQVSVVASTWGAWKQQHPRTRILAEDGGIDRSYPLDPLGGRDDDGPIFPVGPVDPRLPVQAPVVGVVLTDGQPVAFPVEDARRELAAGREVVSHGVTAHLDGDGIRVVADNGESASHQAFWFAWSQFHPDTALWSPEVSG